MQKDRLETTIPLRTKQILTQSSHRQVHRRAGRGPFKDTDGMEITEERQSPTSFPYWRHYLYCHWLYLAQHLIPNQLLSRQSYLKSMLTFQSAERSHCKTTCQDFQTVLTSPLRGQHGKQLVVPRKNSDQYFGQGERAKARKGLSTVSLQVEKAQSSAKRDGAKAETS